MLHCVIKVKYCKSEIVVFMKLFAAVEPSFQPSFKQSQTFNKFIFHHITVMSDIPVITHTKKLKIVCVLWLIGKLRQLCRRNDV